MKVFEIIKKSGKKRRIFAPSPDELEKYRDILPEVKQPVHLLSNAHGFMTGRNIVTNAMPHIGHEVTISVDISDFFDSIRPAQLTGKIPAIAAENCFLDQNGKIDPENGAPRQGLPTSPAIANLAAIPLDAAIKKYLKRLKISYAYTRYADDLSISILVDPGRDQLVEIRNKVYEIIKRIGFTPNIAKTRIQYAKSGKREICGVMVDDRVDISRKMKRKIRALAYQVAQVEKQEKETKKLDCKLKGLREFSKLKMPLDPEEKRRRETEKLRNKRFAQALKLCREYGLAEPVDELKVFPEWDLGDNCFVTNDPVMMLLMSSCTTGWESCMRIDRGQFREGLPFWVSLSGVSLAYLAGDGKKSIRGIRRPTMRERALVYARRDGSRVYGDLYSGYGHGVVRNRGISVLIDKLLDAGFIPAGQTGRELVLGNVPENYILPYFDNATAESVKVAKGEDREVTRIKV